MKDEVLLIQEECSRVGATLIAVSKTKPIEEIQKVYDLGIRDFGENKVQELLTKIDVLPKDIKWHMIGHLQTNKVKDIIDKVYMIHSVDSIKLAKEINKQAIKKDIKVNILIEINIGNEESKFGLNPVDLESFLKEIKELTNLNVLGLMCVAPYKENNEDTRIYFKEMKKLKETYNLQLLSMGMSNDYKIALEEGSNYIRVGTLIFGERDYSK